MAVTITTTNLLTTLTASDATTGWSAGSLDTTVFIQGTGCLAGQVSNTTSTFTYTHGSTVDFTTGDKHVYIWILCTTSGLLGTTLGTGTGKENGLRLRVGQDASNYKEFNLGGKTQYPGGWVCFAVDPNATADATAGTADLTIVDTYSLICTTTGMVTGSSNNLFWDALRYGTGYRITGGTSGDPGTFDQIYAEDSSTTNAYGIVQKSKGVFFVQGELIFGDTGAATNSTFTDSGQIVVFQHALVSSTLYKVKVEAHASATNVFQLGNVVGSGDTSVGAQGMTITSGAINSTGSFTYNENGGSPDTITRSSGNFINDGFRPGMKLRVSGTTSNNGPYTINTVASTTLTLVTADDLAAEGPVTSTLSGSIPYDFFVDDADLDTLKLYDTKIDKADAIEIGDTSTALSATTVELVDSVFSGGNTIVKNVTTSSPAPLYLRNTIPFSSNRTAAINLIDSGSVDVDQFQIVESPKFQNTGTAATRTVSGHTFTNTAANKPYINIQDSASDIWNMDNPNNGSGGRPSITDQTELAFAGNANGDVNERYIVTWNVSEPDGTAINAARVKIVETAPSVAIANQDSSDSNGDASSTYLRALYEPSGASTLTTTTHTPNSFKTYKYGYLPSVSSATIDQPVTNNIAMLDDTFQVETTAATARTLGDTTNTVAIEQQTNSATILKYTAGTNTLSVGQIVGNNSNAAEGTVVEIMEGNSTAGTILLDTRNATAWPTGAHTLDNAASGGTWTATFSSGSIRNYKWLIDSDSLSMQELYDYLNAKLEESPIDTASPSFMDTVITWGRAEHGTPVQGDGTKFKTVRNVALTQGWAVYNTDLGGVSVYTADDGSTFAPQATVTLEINGVSDGTQCYIEADTGGPESVGTVLMNEAANSSGIAQQSYTYTSNQPVIIKARYLGYLPFETTGTITSSGLTTTAVWQLDPNMLVQASNISVTIANANPDTITRNDGGNFLLDGWDYPGYVTISGSTSNDGKYQINATSGVTATVLTLNAGESLSAEGPTTGVTLTWSRT